MTLRKSMPFWAKKANSGPDPDAFIMTFALNASDSITLPITAAGSYNFTVEWGDGTSDVITSGTSPARIHNYTGQPAGDYVVTITGTCTFWSFGSVPTSRTKLKRIDQWGDLGLTTLSFFGCSSLLSVSGGLKFAGTSLTSLFQDCTLLNTIPANLFEFCGAVTNFSNAFYKTTAAAFTIPSGLFDACVSATNFFTTFFRCRFTSIPTDLFRFNTAATNFGGCFAGNNLLTSIPIDLFRYNTAATIFGSNNGLFGLFANCTSLTSLPVDLFRYNTSATSFENSFSVCSGLASLPVDLFRYNTAATNFNGVFNSCSGLTSLPVDLFRYNTLVTTFASCFQNCTGLTSLPVDLFRYNTSVTNFQNAFSGCTALSAIPVDLFRYNTSVTNFSQIFYSCSNSSLSIPSTLFDACINATNFFGAFYDTRFAAIPADLFRFNTLATNFAACFANNPNLNFVPSDLFRYNTSVTTFGNANILFGVFARCTSLTSIPTDLFNFNTNVTNYQNAFNGCVALTTSVSALVAGMDMTKVTTTNQMFSGCTNLTGNGQDLIDKPKAAGYTVGTATNTGSYRTFFNCTSLTDFATIPADYK